jgi:hypothetical protein
VPPIVKIKVLKKGAPPEWFYIRCDTQLLGLPRTIVRIFPTSVSTNLGSNYVFSAGYFYKKPIKQNKSISELFHKISRFVENSFLIILVKKKFQIQAKNDRVRMKILKHAEKCSPYRSLHDLHRSSVIFVPNRKLFFTKMIRKQFCTKPDICTLILRYLIFYQYFQ